MNPDQKTPPPVDPTSLEGGMGIHMGYMRRDIDEIKVLIKETRSEVQNIGNTFVTNAAFLEHLKQDEDHEARIRVQEKNSEALSGDVATIKKLVFGAVGFILIAVLGAIIYLVLPHT